MRPGDPDYVHDRRLDFDEPTEDNDWDEVDSVGDGVSDAVGADGAAMAAAESREDYEASFELEEA